MGKDGMQWWIGEVEDNQDPLQINRVKCRVLGWYTNPDGGSTKDLPTEDMPWAIVLQPTTQSGNDGQGESSGQLQPGAIVMGFFLDGEEAQMPVVMGVLRVIKSSESRDKTQFVFTGDGNKKVVNFATATASNVTIGDKDKTHANQNTSVQTAGSTEQAQSSPTNPNNLGTKTATGTTSAATSLSSKPRAAADGVGGPAKTLVTHITSLVEDVAKHVVGLVKRDGVYIKIQDGTPVALEQITSSVRNAFMALGAQAVAAMREYLNELASMLSKGASLIATFTGIPTATMLLIKTAIELILKQLCILDKSILPFAMIAISPFDALIDLALSKAMSYVELVDAMLSELAAHLVQSYNLIVCKVLQIVSAAEKILAGIGAAKKIIDTWKAGSKIFAEGLDLQKLGLMDFIQLVLFLFNLFDLGCGRKRQRNKGKGFVPILGSTDCVDEEGAKAMAILRGRSDCGLGSSGWDGATNKTADFISQIFNDASPFLTSARTELSGAYTQHTGTPGRWSEVKRLPSGTTHTSIHTDDRQYGEFLASKAGTDEKKTLQRSNSSTGKPVVGDHTTYAGAYTCDVTKDLCYLVHGDEMHTVAGDYHLKVDGNFHLEIGGALMIHAVGAPQYETTQGQKLGNTDKAQKHSINFGSDVDINASGATMKLNATEMTVTGMDTKLGAPSGTLSIDSPSTSIRGGDIIISANNTITETCGTLFQNINFPQLPRAKSGIFVNCAGPVDYILTPAPSFDPLPRFSINTVGPFMVKCAAGGALFTVAAGLFSVKVAAGAITMTASAAVSITAGAVMTLKAGGAVNILGATINLN